MLLIAPVMLNGALRMLSEQHPRKPEISGRLRPVFPAKGSLGTAHRRKLRFGGLTRTYLIQPVNAAGQYPVVFVLHGGTQTAEQVWTQTSLPTLGARDRFIVVAPQGVGNHWNDGRGSTIAGDAASAADDVGFLHALIAEVIRTDRGDPAAIFMVGPSNGGFMTMRFACDRAADLRAASNVISDLPSVEASACHPSKPLPWLSINGTADPLIPFSGQTAGTMKRGRPQPGLLSAEATFAFWADRAGCSNDIHSEHLPDVVTSDLSWVEKRVRTGCVDGTVSVQYVLHGAGHTWPNGRDGLVARMLGGSNQDVDSGEIIWSYFRSTLRGHVQLS